MLLLQLNFSYFHIDLNRFFFNLCCKFIHNIQDYFLILKNLNFITFQTHYMDLLKYSLEVLDQHFLINLDQFEHRNQNNQEGIMMNLFSKDFLIFQEL